MGTGDIVTLPSDYQTSGGAPDNEEVESIVAEGWAADELDSMPVATIEDWLLSPAPVEAWVPLRTRNMKVKLRGLTEDERRSIEKRAPRKPNKQTKRAEPDQDWINIELVRTSLLEPQVPSQDMLTKALAGELAYLAKEIGKLSGFDLDASDALG
jgi:hypothetical protein